MATLNKISVAAEMFLEAHHRFTTAQRDIDYIVSIVMSGSVMGIVSPLLSEQGGRPIHSLFAELATKFDSPGAPRTHEGVFRAVYNGLKHAGDLKRKVAPSTDLEIDTHLKAEAAHMLDDARHDFRQIKITPAVRASLSREFVDLLESDTDYA